VLLVDDDQAQARHRREDRHARAQHQIGMPQVRGQPALQPLRRRQAAVQRHQTALREARHQPRLQLRRQVDLRHQHQRLPPGREHPLGLAQVDLGLAAAGGAEQQPGRRGVGAGQRVERPALVVRQRGRLGRCRHLGHLDRFGGQPLVQPLQPPRQLRRVQLAQVRRQRAQRHLAEAALVVARGERRQPAPRHAKRRQRIERLRDAAQLDRRGVRHRIRSERRIVPDDATHLARAQRHAHQRAGRPCRLGRVVEQRVKPAVARQVDEDLQPDVHRSCG
jgi:hypothetical protein